MDDTQIPDFDFVGLATAIQDGVTEPVSPKKPRKKPMRARKVIALKPAKRVLKKRTAKRRVPKAAAGVRAVEAVIKMPLAQFLEKVADIKLQPWQRRIVEAFANE